MQRFMAERGLAHEYACPALPPLADQAISAVERTLGPNDCFIGSSLGGFYATYLAHRHGVNAVLLNPAVRPHQRLERYLGLQRNVFSGEEYELTGEHIAQWQALDIPVTQPERFLLIVESGDEVLDYRLAVDKYAGAEQIVIEGGDHSLQSFPRHIPRILRFAGMSPAL